MCSEWVQEEKIGSGHTRAHEPDGDAYADGSISIHHGLCVLESWQASRACCVSDLILLNPHHACMHEVFFFFWMGAIYTCVFMILIDMR